MNVTVNDIRGIKPGCTIEFYCNSNEAVKCAQSLVSYCNKIKKHENVWKYISSADFKKMSVKITAIARDGVKDVL